MSHPPARRDRSSVTVSRTADGRTEVHKRAPAGARADELVREGAALRRGRHPGVVDLVDLHITDDGAADLVTRFAGTHTLATWTPTSLDEIAGLLVALAETLADLHHLGIAHGDLDPAHVVIDPDGRPVLCGFERTLDHRPTDDVAGLGHLARRLLEPGGYAGDAAPRERRRDSSTRRRLLDLADQACADDEVRRPGARRFAAALVAVAPAAAVAAPAPDQPDGADQIDLQDLHHSRDPHEGPRLGETADAHGRDRPEPAPRRGVLTAIAVIGLACVVFGALSAWTGERPELTAASLAAPGPAGTVRAVTSATPGSPSPDPGDGPPPTPAAPAHEADCSSPEAACSSVQPGGVLDHQGRRFALGDTTDQILVAGAGCPEPPALALLRPDGATFGFDEWAEPGREVVAGSGPAVPAGSRWVPQPIDHRGCARLVVRHLDGTIAEIHFDGVETTVTTSSVAPADDPHPDRNAPGPPVDDVEPTPTDQIPSGG